MSTKFALICTIFLVVLDLLLTYILIMQPQKDRVHGGMGQALMVMYGLGVMLLLILYGAAFLLVHYKQWFAAANVMCWLLVGLNGVFLLLLLLIWATSKS